MTPRRQGRCPAQLPAEHGSRVPLLCRCGRLPGRSPETEPSRGAPWGPDGDGGPTSRAPAPSRRPPVPSAAARVSTARTAAGESFRLRDPRPPPPLSMPTGRPTGPPGAGWDEVGWARGSGRRPGWGEHTRGPSLPKPQANVKRSSAPLCFHSFRARLSGSGEMLKGLGLLVVRSGQSRVRRVRKPP